MNFFRKKNRGTQAKLLKPRRNRMFRALRREEISAGERKFSVWNFFYGTLWVLFAGAALWVVFFSSLLRIGRTEVSGAETVSKRDIERVVSEFSAGAIFGAPRNTLAIAFARRHALERKLRERFPIFRSVRISFVFPETIRVSVEERTLTMILCSGGPCFLVDERGMAFDGADVPEASFDVSRMLAVVDQSGKPVSFQAPVLSEGFLETFSSIRERLFTESDVTTSSSGTTPSCLSDEIRLRTTEGWELRLSSTVPIERTFLALRLLFEKTLPESDRKNLEYVDLRTENRIFYSLKGGEEKEGEKMGDDERKGGKKKKKDEQE